LEVRFSTVGQYDLGLKTRTEEGSISYAEKGDISSLQRDLNDDADINTQTAAGYSALLTAARGHQDVAAVLRR
jgi:hypothetical protein